MRRNNRIVVTRADVERLRAILGSRSASELDREHLRDLREELEQARVVGEHEIAPGIVTLQSQVRVRNRETGVSSDYTVVSPGQANVALGHISVVAPLGTALLGYCEGDEIDWEMPGGVRRLLIERVRQPNGPKLERTHEAGGALPHAAA